MGRIQPNDVEGSVLGQDASSMEYLDDQTYTITFEHQRAADDNNGYSSDDAESWDSHVDGSDGVRGADPPPPRGGDGLAPIALLDVSDSNLGEVEIKRPNPNTNSTVPAVIDIALPTSSYSVVSTTTNHTRNTTINPSTIPKIDIRYRDRLMARYVG